MLERGLVFSAVLRRVRAYNVDRMACDQRVPQPLELDRLVRFACAPQATRALSPDDHTGISFARSRGCLPQLCDCLGKSQSARRLVRIPCDTSPSLDGRIDVDAAPCQAFERPRTMRFGDPQKHRITCFEGRANGASEILQMCLFVGAEKQLVAIAHLRLHYFDEIQTLANEPSAREHTFDTDQ
jgi:hypothetical protein